MFRELLAHNRVNIAQCHGYQFFQVVILKGSENSVI